MGELHGNAAEFGLLQDRVRFDLQIMLQKWVNWSPGFNTPAIYDFVLKEKAL